MPPKARNITGWILAGILCAVFVLSAAMKFKGGPDTEKMTSAMGLTASGIKGIGALEIICALLFLIPRTGVLGTLLMAAYSGGIIATHLEHGMPVTVPVVIACLIFITAAVRFPELTRRLLGKGDPNTAA